MRWHRINDSETHVAMGSLIEIARKWEGLVADGKFPLRQWLGSSEHSAVFLTERSANGSQKNAAIKLISAEVFSAGNLDEAAQLSRWVETAKLSHPHLIRLFENGRCQIDGTSFLYVVMEYAEENLAQILPQRALSPAEVKEMLPPTVEALLFLHQAGFVHAHLKPSNVLAVDNQLKISSDSLRKPGEPDKQTPSAYLAPDLATTGPSPAGDAWSLGVMLVAIMTQLEPRIGNDGAAAIPFTIPQPFYEIAQRCLRVDPSQRSTLDRVLGSPKVQEPLTVKAIRKPPSRKRGKVWLILPVAAAVILLAFLFGKSHQQPSPPTGATESQTPTASAPAEQTPAPFAGKTSPPQVRTDRGSVSQQVLPEVSRSAQNTITGRVKVRVQVSVDAGGNVTQAKLVSPGPSQYFARQALSAARRWKFSPPQVNGQPSSSEWMMRFEFGRKSIQAFSSELKP
jgi:TonB family protein